MTRITQKELKEIMEYNPDTGEFIRKVSGFGFKEGSLVGSAHSGGYIETSIKCERYYLHRLAWLYMTGEWPNIIDHINHDRADNRWENLRNVDSKGNCENLSLSKNNKSGITGVSWEKRSKKWAVFMSRKNKTIYLGKHDDFFEACCTRLSANNKHGFHENHGSKLDKPYQI